MIERTPQTPTSTVGSGKGDSYSKGGSPPPVRESAESSWRGTLGRGGAPARSPSPFPRPHPRPALTLARALQAIKAASRARFACLLPRWHRSSFCGIGEYEGSAPRPARHLFRLLIGVRRTQLGSSDKEGGQAKRPSCGVPLGAGTKLKPEANGSLSLPYPQQHKQKALIGLAWRLGGLVVMESPDGRVREISRVNLQTDQELRASRRSCSRRRGCSRSSGVESY